MAWHYALPLLTKVYQNRSIDQIFGKKRSFLGRNFVARRGTYTSGHFASLAKAEAIVFNCVYLHQKRR